MTTRRQQLNATVNDSSTQALPCVKIDADVFEKSLIDLTDLRHILDYVAYTTEHAHPDDAPEQINAIMTLVSRDLLRINDLLRVSEIA